MSRQGCADAEQLSVIRLGWQDREGRAEECRQKEKPGILLDGHDEPHVVKNRLPGIPGPDQHVGVGAKGGFAGLRGI